MNGEILVGLFSLQTETRPRDFALVVVFTARVRHRTADLKIFGNHLPDVGRHDDRGSVVVDGRDVDHDCSAPGGGPGRVAAVRGGYGEGELAGGTRNLKKINIKMFVKNVCVLEKLNISFATKTAP